MAKNRGRVVKLNVKNQENRMYQNGAEEMKRIPSLILFFVCMSYYSICYGIEKTYADLIEKDFEGEQFKVVDENVDYCGKRFILVASYTGKYGSMIKKATVYEVKGNNIEPKIEFLSEKVVDQNGNILIDMGIHPWKFYGWEIYVSHRPTSSGYYSGLGTVYYMEGGDRVSEGPSFEFNCKKDSFNRLKHKYE